MNTRDLEDLLEIQDKYVPVSQISKNGIINAGKPIPSGAIRTQQNTYEVAKQCDALIKKAVEFLAEKGVSFEQLVISSNLGVFCRLDYFNELQKYYLHNTIEDEKLDDLMKTLHIKIFPQIVPITFRINSVFSGIENCDIQNKLGDNNLFLESVSGIVNWEYFIMEMNLLGYNIDLLSDRKGLSFFDYTMAVKQNDSNNKINIIADSGRTKKYILSKM